MPHWHLLGSPSMTIIHLMCVSSSWHTQPTCRKLFIAFTIVGSSLVPFALLMDLRKKGSSLPASLAIKRAKGTREEPTIVNAMNSFRHVGCVCHEEDTHIKWMIVMEGEPRRCQCGYWFELKVHPAPNKFELPV